MSAWPLAKISQLTTKVGSGATPNGGESAYKPTGTPLIRSMNVHFGGFKRDGLAFLDDKQAEGLANAIVKANDVLLNITGASIGRVTWAPADLDGARVNQHVCIIRPREGLEPKFLAHFLASPPQQRRIMNEQVGATRQGLTKGRILEFDVPVPPLPEQHRIVAKIEELFSDLDAGVAALERVRANLKRYRAAVLKAAVEGRLTAAWREQNPTPPDQTGAALLQRILAERRAKWEQDQLRKFKEAGKTPPKGWKERYEEAATVIPAGLSALPLTWCRAAIRNIGHVQLGRQRAPQHHSGTHMRPYLRVANVFENRIDTSDVMEMNFTPDEFETYRLKPKDILLNEGQSMELVGRPAMYRGEVPGACFTNTLVRFQAGPAVLPDFALLVFLAYLKNGRFQRIATITVNIAHLGAGRFAELEFPLPPLAEQAEIVAEVDRRLSVADAAEMQVEHALQRAARLRQSILKRAFEGGLVGHGSRTALPSLPHDRPHGPQEVREEPPLGMNADDNRTTRPTKAKPQGTNSRR